MLSNFMRRNGKRKAAKNAKGPQTHRRQPSPSSPASFTSPEILDINEKSFNIHSQGGATSEWPGSIPEGSAPTLQSTLGSPLVHLDLLTEPLEDWFPQDLLRGNRSSRDFLPGASVQRDAEKESAKFSSTDPSSKPIVNVTDMGKSEKQPGTRTEETGRPVAALKKSIPAPIVIPDADLLAPNVRIGHSAATVDGLPRETSEPPTEEALPNAVPSPVPSEDMSAVSGTTLARALIGNSFVLSSSEHRGSRHRSGMARQDSATLPRGEHWRDRPTSGLTSESGRTSPVPPVPPMPAGVLLEKYPQQYHILDRSQVLANPDSGSSNSVPSTASEYPMSSYAVSPEPIVYSSISHRISRIPEVPSPAPTTPMTSQSAPEVQDLSFRTSPAAQSISAATSVSENFVAPNNATDGSLRPYPHQPADFVIAESSPNAPFSPSTTDTSLDEYSFVPIGSQVPIGSPGSDSSASYIAPLPTKRSDNSLKRRKIKVGAASFAEGRARLEFTRGTADFAAGTSFHPNKKSLKAMPFKAPRPLLVPQTPITPALIASSLVAPYSSLSQFPLVPASAVSAIHLEMPNSARDHQDSAVNSATTSISVRQRSYVTDPLSVDQDYGDLLNYALTVSPDPGSSSHYTPTSSSAGYQTFPETPMVFSPLWSPDYSRPPGSALRYPLERKQLPRSATLPGPRDVGKGSLARTRTRIEAGKEDEEPSKQMPRRPQSTNLPPSSSPDNSSLSACAPPVVTSGQTADREPIAPGLVSLPSSLTTDSRDNVATPVHTSESVKSSFRPHPLAHISTSSSQLQEEEALQALVLHSAPSTVISDPMSPDWKAGLYPVSPALVPLPESTSSSPLLPLDSAELVPSPGPSHFNRSTLSPLITNHPESTQASSIPFTGSSFLPSVSPAPSSPVSPVAPSPKSPAPTSPVISSPSSSPVSSPPSPVPSTPSVSLSFIAPPPYHTVVSERTAHHPLMSSGSEALSRVLYERERQPSLGASPRAPPQNRARARPPLPIGPRKPSGPVQPLGTLVPGIRERGNSVSSVGSSNPGAGLSSSPWRKLYSAASQPPPKFQIPPPKWRGLTMEAAQWTFTSHQLQTVVSRAIKQSAEGTSIRLLRPETLDGEIAEEIHRLEMRRTDVKSQYKMLVRKRWNLMGALAGHIEGADGNDTGASIRTVEELAEVSLGLDQLTDELHGIVEQLAQLKSLRDVHTGSALAMALRKVNSTFLKQVAELERLRDQVDTLEAERDEAWKHAETVAQDYDDLNDRIKETEGETCKAADTRSNLSNKRSAQLSAVRKSSIRQSKAGLRGVSRSRKRRSSLSSAGTRGSVSLPASSVVEGVPPVPPLPLHQLGVSSNLPSGMSSYYSGSSAAQALALAQRELYDMLGLDSHGAPNEVFTRPRSLSGPHNSKLTLNNPRPMSDTGTGSFRLHPHENRTIHSVILDERRAMLATLGLMSN